VVNSTTGATKPRRGGLTGAGNGNAVAPAISVPESKMLARRFEYKYIVTEAQAHSIYDFVRCHLDPDQHTVDGFTEGYPVHSLYLDSPDLYTCMATMQGLKNRFKLRVRFYDENPNTPVFFEIKRRDNSVILKQRAMVWRRYVNDLLFGASPSVDHLARNDTKNWKALYEFCHLRDLLTARPTAFTSYMRAGYEPAGQDNSIRVTFDRHLRAGKFHGDLSALDEADWPLVNVPGVVLELKFNDRFPNWMHELTQLFDLRRGSMPKYVECVSLITEV
jgi:hypothetical protein